MNLSFFQQSFIALFLSLQMNDMTELKEDHQHLQYLILILLKQLIVSPLLQ
jgi:hypothetical protein